MRSYEDNNPRGWLGDPKRGAALGRCSEHKQGYTGTLHLSIVELDSLGYDRLGTYWGVPQRGPLSNLWWVRDDEGEVDYCIRADNFVAAAHAVNVKYPGCNVVEAPPEEVQEEDENGESEES
jgi:hypothetical protein